MSFQATIYEIADELRGIASLGLRFSENPYDREAYQKVLQASARLVAALEVRPTGEVMAQYQDNLHHISPLAGAEGVVVRQVRMLLIRRSDNGLWAVPGGLVEVGQTLAGAALRELKEETGLDGQITRLLGIFDSRRWKSRIKAQLYHAVFQVEVGDSHPSPGPEALDVGFFAPDALPPLSPGHEMRIPVLFKILNGELPCPYYDE